MNADSVELALQVDGYGSHDTIGTWLLVLAARGVDWEKAMGGAGLAGWEALPHSYEASSAASVREWLDHGKWPPGLFLGIYIPASEWARPAPGAPDGVRAAVHAIMVRGGEDHDRG